MEKILSLEEQVAVTQMISNLGAAYNSLKDSGEYILKNRLVTMIAVLLNKLSEQ